MLCKHKTTRQTKAAYHHDYCKPQETVSCRRGRDRHVRCPASFAIGLQQVCIQLRLVNFNRMMGRAGTLLCHPDARWDAAFRRGRPAVTRGSKDGVRICCKIEVRKRPWEWRSYRHVFSAPGSSVVVAQDRQPCLLELVGLVVADRCRKDHGSRRTCSHLCPLAVGGGRGAKVGLPLK